LALLGAAILAAIWSEQQDQAWKGVKTLWGLLWIFLAQAVMRTRSDFRPPTLIFFLSAAAAGIYGWLETIGFFGPAVPRSCGTHSFFTYSFLMTLSALWSFRYIWSAPIRSSWPMLIVFLGSCFGIVAEGSIAAVVAFGFGFCFILLFSSNRKQWWPATVSLLVLLAAAYFMADSVVVGVKITRLWDSLADSGTSGGIRVTLWRASLYLFLESPIFGCGLGDFRSAFEQVFHANDWFEGRVLPPNQIIHAHSTYFHLLATQGIFGVSVFVWWWVSLVRTLWNARVYAAYWVSVSFVGLVAFLGMGIAEPVFASYSLAAVLTPCGVAIALANKAKRSLES
jgi:O-antigen ligase